MVPEKADAVEKKMQEATYQAVANIIRKKSEGGRFTFQNEIFQELMDRKVLKLDNHEQPGTFKAILKETIEGNEDLKELHGKDGITRYYSSQCMSERYVRILLCKEENLLLLIAETVRENSATYPRPVPIDIFLNLPFELTREEMLSCLQKMSGQEEYQDIAQTKTSIGTIFLYSNRYLDPDYAYTLAEWVDVGQAANP